ncbi:MAG TPA: hypothetical protein VK929_08615 [Longimicrobiales bacterium]|nr:hypothetical protein [Longimicrobiales bacterium]
MEAWIPVAFAAVIVIGVVGGQLAHMVLKELLPLLRTIAEQRQHAVPAQEATRIAEALASLDRRLERLEAGHERLDEDRRFVQQLLAGRDQAPAPAPDDAERRNGS